MYRVSEYTCTPGMHAAHCLHSTRRGIQEGVDKGSSIDDTRSRAIAKGKTDPGAEDRGPVCILLKAKTQH